MRGGRFRAFPLPRRCEPEASSGWSPSCLAHLACLSVGVGNPGLPSEGSEICGPHSDGFQGWLLPEPLAEMLRAAKRLRLGHQLFGRELEGHDDPR